MGLFAMEKRGAATVAWAKGTAHREYEDRYRLLPMDVPLVEKAERGEIFGIFDGIGSAPKGRAAAQQMADQLTEFFKWPKRYPASPDGINKLLLEGNRIVNDWGVKLETDVPLGGCAGTVVWFDRERLHIFHAGDTCAILLRDGHVDVLTTLHQAPDGALYRYFGLGPLLQLECRSILVEELDRILLISDGVTKSLAAIEAGRFIADIEDPGQAVKKIMTYVQSAGGKDDITILLLEAEELWW